MNIDERFEALTMNLKLVYREIQDLKATAEQDGENIRALARIARSGSAGSPISKAANKAPVTR